jgi:protocatechuate 3,4-dioxygenase beta subunit
MRTRLLIRFVVALAAAGGSTLAMAQTAAVPAGPHPPAQPAAPVRDPGGRPATTPLPAGNAVLAGTITTAAGQPVAGARVMLNGGDGPGRTTTTDARGQFVIEGLRTGRYYVNVMKPGFMSLSYGQRRVNTMGTAIPLKDGERRAIELQLPRAAVITGMILDERGEPSINTQVRGMRYTMVNGRRRAQQVANDSSDDRGIYRLHSLQPGEYAVCAVARNMGPMNDAQRIQMEVESARRAIENAPSAAAKLAIAERLKVLEAQKVDQTEPNLGYAPVCYPSSSAPSAAVTVAAGEERSGIDLQMVMIPVARIEGTVVAPGGGAPRNMQLTLVNADENMGDVDRQGTGFQQGNGQFSFQNVAPGRYSIMARTMTFGPPPPPGVTVPKEPLLWGMSEVVINGQDVSGVVVELHPGITVTGQMTFQPTMLAPPTDLSRAQISIFPFMPDSSSMMMVGPPPQGKVDASGRFTIPDVVPGKYRMSAGVIGVQGWVVDSITAGGQDVLDFPLEIKGARDVSDVAVVFGDRISELSGTITDQKGEPATEQTILLYPTDQKYWTPSSRRIRTMRAGADGLFNFRTVPPGEYRLTTLVDPEPGIWYDREVLETLDSSSIRIVIAEGEKKVEHVKIR